ncbi:hypothetical protein [Burkholderia sp. Bp9004]|uniref:rolling circle replication-associated protein n=1 Tax=Burkholderia sp. Bp9004 TaxID=2184559 RepID=UPI001639ABA6|nr:hypothetical protein [Burkholderia sp. Bp9004]
MSLVSPTAARRPCLTAASALRFAELVRKIERSATPSAKKRKNKARKTLLSVIKALRRQARTTGLWAVALTLTFADDGELSPGHLSDFLERVRKALKRRGYALPYAWVLERGGRLHYHLTLWLPRGFELDKAKLAQWWPWGATWTAACRHVKRWACYMAKFNCVARLPKGARLFGYGGLDESGKAAAQHAALPRWLQALVPRGTRVCRVPGGGWANTDTGEIHRSPYRWTPRGWAMCEAEASPPPAIGEPCSTT